MQALLQSHRDLEQSVAHELRTPLAQLKFDLELARTSGEDARARASASRRWSKDVVDLEELVAELLVLASLREAPPYQPREVPAAALVDDVLRRAQDEMRASGRTIAIDAAAQPAARASPATRSTSRARW